MGLDMYLRTHEYVSGYQFQPPEAQERYRAILGAAGIRPGDVSPDTPSLHLQVTVAYWRKANAIHAWFVRECQNGVDECQEAYVPRDKLTELAVLCEHASETRDPSLLPPQSGFFFGGTDIDEWYWKDLEDTAKRLREILANPRWENVDFIYQSSW